MLLDGDGRPWTSLGVVQVRGGRLWVDLSAGSADGLLVADAIRLVAQDTPDYERVALEGNPLDNFSHESILIPGTLARTTAAAR